MAAGDVVAADAGLFDRRGANTAFEGSFPRAEPGTVNAVVAVYQTGGTTVVTETLYYAFGGSPVAMRRVVDGQDQGVEFLLGDHLGSTAMIRLTTDCFRTDSVTSEYPTRSYVAVPSSQVLFSRFRQVIRRGVLLFASLGRSGADSADKPVARHRLGGGCVPPDNTCCGT